MTPSAKDSTAASPAIDGRLLFARGALPAWIFDRATLGFLDVNDAAVRSYGWSRAEFLGMDLYAVRPPAEHERLRAYVADLDRPVRDHGPWLHWRKDGTVMEVQVHTVDLPYSGRACRLSTMFDVTEANATARALRDSEGWLRTIVEHMPVMLDALDERGRIVFWNREAERVTGYSREEVVDNPAFFETAYPDRAYRERMFAEWRQRGDVYRDWEWTITCKDGSRRVIAWSNVSARAPVAGWASWGVGIDVTLRREAEAQAQALSRRLLAVQEEERRAVSLELHDDIGQALTAVKLNLEAARRDAATAAAAAPLEDSIALVEDAIRDVRALAYSLRPQILDELGLPQALGWLVERARERTGVSAVANIAIPDLAVDPVTSAACFRIAQEALTNVARHSHASRVTVSLTADSGALVLRVEDDGDGFDLEAAQDRARRGDGLGVPGMEERARLAGGRLEIHATAGSGTQVCAVFPRGG